MAARKRRMVNPVKRPGALTAKAKRRGMTPQQFANYVLSHKSQFDTRTIRQAVFARNAKRVFRHKGRRRK